MPVEPTLVGGQDDISQSRVLTADRYEDLVDQGVPLQQSSIPSTSSFSNMSSASQDIAPDTPHRSPTHPPSPSHYDSHATGHSSTNTAQPSSHQAPPWEMAGDHSTPKALSIDAWDEVQYPSQQGSDSNSGSRLQFDTDLSSAQQQQREGRTILQAAGDVEMHNLRPAPGSAVTEAQTDDRSGHLAPPSRIQTMKPAQKQSGRQDELPSSPLLASSRGTLLSEKLANTAQLLSQDTTLSNHQDEKCEDNTVGLSKVAVQTGFRAAGKVSLTEGMSEPVTEALEARSPVGNGFEDVVEPAADNKGRIMQVGRLSSFCRHLLPEGFLQDWYHKTMLQPSCLQP